MTPETVNARHFAPLAILSATLSMARAKANNKSSINSPEKG
ncbi:hypothetical protein [Campylobacter sp. RM16189]